MIMWPENGLQEGHFVTFMHFKLITWRQISHINCFISTYWKISHLWEKTNLNEFILRFDFVRPPFWQPFSWICPKNLFLSLRLHNSYTIQVTAEIFPVLLLLTFSTGEKNQRLTDAILLAIWPLKVSSKWPSRRPFSHSLLEQFPNLERLTCP